MIDEPSSNALQPIGAHIGLTGSWLIGCVSANIGDHFPVSAPSLIGQPVTALFSATAIHDIRNRMALLQGDGAVEHLFRFPLVDGGKQSDISIYRDGDGFALDLEPSAKHAFGDTAGAVQGMIARLDPDGNVDVLCKQAAHQLRALTGYDQVAISFGGGTLAQSMRPGLEMIAAGMPLAVKAETMIVDRNFVPVAMLGTDGAKETMARSVLRAPSQDEIRFLAANDAHAAYILPLGTEGGGAGQIGCYHKVPRHLGLERRCIAALFAKFVEARLEIAGLRSECRTEA